MTTIEEKLWLYANRVNLQEQDVEYLLSLIREERARERDGIIRLIEGKAKEWVVEEGDHESAAAAGVLIDCIRGRATP